MPEENELRNPVASIELTAAGLVLEVADSVIADGGRGLFIRCLSDENGGEDGYGEVPSVTVDEGTAVCGYAEGEMRTVAESDKTVAFALASLESVVWFDKELRTVGDLLTDESIVRNCRRLHAIEDARRGCTRAQAAHASASLESHCHHHHLSPGDSDCRDGTRAL